MRRAVFCFAPVFLLFAVASCDDGEEGTGQPTTVPDGCLHVIETGDPDGHPDPAGAGAAQQARASRVSEPSLIVQPPNLHQRVRVGDYLLINDKIAVYIEGARASDGFNRLGGGIIAIDQVGNDGRPMGLSQYGETLMGLSNRMVDPETVTVMSDGSDGQAAVIRAEGQLAPLPLLAQPPYNVLFPRQYDLRAAYDYVLEPGADKVTIRQLIVNESDDEINMELDEIHFLLHTSRSQLFTEEFGYEEPSGRLKWMGYDSGPWAFALRSPHDLFWFVAKEDTFTYVNGSGFRVDACSLFERDHLEVIAGGPGIDGLREAIRREDGEPAWREISGSVLDGQGAPVADAWVHELSIDGTYLSRTRTDANGAFVIHAPSAAVTLVPQQQGFPPHDGQQIPADSNQASLSFAPHGWIHVTAVDASSQHSLPVRIQIIPANRALATPDAFGIEDEQAGRLYQHAAVEGAAKLPVPPGEHQVIVTRGVEWELHDTTVTVGEYETVEVSASLERSVDSTGVMCTDFHAHTYNSPDSWDSFEKKVSTGVADGLDIVTISDHEWVTDPQPTLEALGLTQWAFGFPSSELTTFTWGHFGILPLLPKPDELNEGAIDWIEKSPTEVFNDIDSLVEKPLVVVNHPRYAGTQGYFNVVGYKPEKAETLSDLWSENFDIVEVCNSSDFESNREESVADWFSFLEQGKNIWAVGSSDNHLVRKGGYGYPQTCMYFGHDDPIKLSSSLVRDAMASGAAVIRGGIFLSVVGPSGERPGQTVTASGSSVQFTVTIQAPSWIPADTLETIVNGVTLSTEPLVDAGAGPGQRFVHQVEVPIDATRERTWVVFHATADGDLSPLQPGRRPFGVSNPIFIGR